MWQQENHFYGILIKGKDLIELKNIRIGPVINGKRYFSLPNLNLKYLVLRGVSLFSMLWVIACYPLVFQSTIKHEKSFTMVWGRFGNGVVDLVKIDGIMNPNQYHNLLVQHAIPSGTCLVGWGFILQQDSNLKHNSNLCTNYVQSK